MIIKILSKSFNLLANMLPKLGIKTHFVNPDDPESFRRAINDKTRLVYAETIGNPGINLIDIEKIADYITYINNGKIIFTGEKDEFLEKYCIIKGGKEDITESQKKEIIGLRMHSTGFEGLIELKKAVGFSSKVIIEKASLDEIMIYMNKEAM